MRKTTAIITVIIAFNALAVSVWATNGSKRRAKEVTADNGSIKISAGGVLNTTVNIYDGNDIAKAALDYDLIESHRAALQQLGFRTVRVQTARGETLERPL